MRRRLAHRLIQQEKPSPDGFPNPIYVQPDDTLTTDELEHALLQDLGLYTPQTLLQRLNEFKIKSSELAEIHSSRARLTLIYIKQVTANSHKTMISMKKYLRLLKGAPRPSPATVKQRVQDRRTKRSHLEKRIESLLQQDH